MRRLPCEHPIAKLFTRTCLRWGVEACRTIGWLKNVSAIPDPAPNNKKSLDGVVPLEGRSPSGRGDGGRRCAD